jgi:hypothetical protein
MDSMAIGGVAVVAGLPGVTIDVQHARCRTALTARRSSMKNWRRALIFGSLGASAFLLVAGRKPAAGLLAGVGLAAWASEYPEHLQHLWERAPEYVDKGNHVLSMAATFLERLAEHRLLREDSPNVV